MKNAANIGDVPSISKTFNLVIQLKQSCKLYNSGPSKFFQFHFGIEVYFLLFFLSLVERGEKEWLLDSSSRERNLSLASI
jgi:hypothetical protein